MSIFDNFFKIFSKGKNTGQDSNDENFMNEFNLSNEDDNYDDGTSESNNLSVVSLEDMENFDDELEKERYKGIYKLYKDNYEKQKKTQKKDYIKNDPSKYHQDELDSIHKKYDPNRQREKEVPTNPYESEDSKYFNIEQILNSYDEDNITDKSLMYVMWQFDKYLKNTYNISFNSFFNVFSETVILKKCNKERSEIIKDFLNQFDFYDAPEYKKVFDEINKDKDIVNKQFAKKEFIDNLKKDLFYKLQRGHNIDDSLGKAVRKENFSKMNQYFQDNYGISYTNVLKLDDNQVINNDKIKGVTKEQLLKQYLLDNNPFYTIDSLYTYFKPKFDKYINYLYDKGFHSRILDNAKFREIANGFFSQKDIDQELQEKVLKVNENLNEDFKFNLNQVKEELTNLLAVDYVNKDTKNLNRQHVDDFLGKRLDNLKGLGSNRKYAEFAVDFIKRKFNDLVAIINDAKKSDDSNFIFNQAIIDPLNNFISDELDHIFRTALLEKNNPNLDNEDKTNLNYLKSIYLPFKYIKDKDDKFVRVEFNEDELQELKSGLEETIIRFFIQQLNKNTDKMSSEDIISNLNSLNTGKNISNLYQYLQYCDSLFIANKNKSDYEKYKRAFSDTNINYENVINNINRLCEYYYTIKGESLDTITKEQKEKFLNLINETYSSIHEDLNKIIERLQSHNKFMSIQEENSGIMGFKGF